MPRGVKRKRYGGLVSTSYKTAKRRKRNRGRWRPSAAFQRANYRTGGFDDIEVKFVDFTYDAAIVGALAGSETDPGGAGAQTAPGCLNGITQGDGESNRDGRKCTLTSVYVQGTIQMDAIEDANGLTNARTVRLALVLDKQTNKQQLSAEDVFTDPGELPFGFRNLAFTQRFQVLWDKTYNMQATAASGTAASGANDTAGMRRNFKIYKKLRIPVIHTGTTNSVTSISDNSLHLVSWCDAGGACTLKYNSRVRFTG